MRDEVLRIWDETRTSHFELLAKMTPCRFVYRTKNYNFDPEMAYQVNAEQRGVLSTVFVILFGHYRIIELNEPTSLRIWPALLLYSTAVRLRRMLRPTIAVLYAIDNHDQRSFFVQRIKVPGSRFLFTAVFRYLLRTFDRIAFGTEGASLEYHKLGSNIISRRDSVIMTQVPTRCDCGDVEKRAGSVLFVGSLEPRKGVSELLDAWEIVSSLAPELTLKVIGVGRLEEYVRKRVALMDNVSFIVDPPREFVHTAYRQAETVVLLSQPAAGWREQVGLPLVEGVAHGCRLIATEQTGIAAWLADSGHTVIDSGAPANEVAAAVIATAREGLDANVILASLPDNHKRIEADRWLTRSA